MRVCDVTGVQVNLSSAIMMMRHPFSCPVRRNFLSGIQVEFKQSQHQRSLRAQLHWMQVNTHKPTPAQNMCLTHVTDNMMVCRWITSFQALSSPSSSTLFLLPNPLPWTQVITSTTSICFLYPANHIANMPTNLHLNELVNHLVSHLSAFHKNCFCPKTDNTEERMGNLEWPLPALLKFQSKSDSDWRCTLFMVKLHLFWRIYRKWWIWAHEWAH